MTDPRVTVPSSRRRRTVPIVLHSFDLTTGQARALPTPYGANAQSALLMSNETITGCTALADGNLVLAVTPLNVGRSEHTAPRLTLLSTPAHSVELMGLQARQQLGDLVAMADGRLYEDNAYGTQNLREVDPTTGAILRSVAIPQGFAEGIVKG